MKKSILDENFINLQMCSKIYIIVANIIILRKGLENNSRSFLIHILYLRENKNFNYYFICLNKVKVPG
jgi:hypothetical protein